MSEKEKMASSAAQEQFDVQGTYVCTEQPIMEREREGLSITSSNLRGKEAADWFAKDYNDDFPLRIVSRQTTAWPGPRTAWPFPESIFNEVLNAYKKAYEDLWGSETGGSIAITLSPTKFYVQTPFDGGPFCSFALSTTGFGRGLVRGIFYYTDPAFEPSKILPGSRIYSGWRSDGFFILVPVVAFLGAHVAYKARELESLRARIGRIESILSEPRHPDDDSLDFGALTRNLHECSTILLRLERRARFETGLVKSIESYLAFSVKQRTSNMGVVESPFELQKNLMEAQGYDLESLPKRIESQRTMIFNLIVQRDQRLNIQIGRSNMEIAESSHHIAEASMRESQSMRTIAVLTMVFLPGTAVASFFSMTMFNWYPGPGQHRVTGYIWIYFVVSTPLTIAVIFVWWYFLRKQSKRLARLRHKGTFIENVHERLDARLMAQRDSTHPRVQLPEAGFGADGADHGVKDEDLV